MEKEFFQEFFQEFFIILCELAVHLEAELKSF